MCRKLLSAAAAACLASAVGATNTSANTVISSGPGNIAGDQNILFNQVGLLGTGLEVQGVTNQSGELFDFTSLTSLATPSGGQAKIAASAAAGTFTNLTFASDLAGGMFTSLIFNPNAAADGTIVITANPLGESPVIESFALSKNGQNFFQVLATNGERLSSVSFTSTAAISDVSQIRVGTAAVPVPNSIWGGAVLIGGLAVSKFRARRLT